jgi:protein tyrosine phosphatase
MKDKKSFVAFFFLLGFVFVACLQAQRNPNWANLVDTKSVSNLYLVDTGVYRCAQPDAAAFAELEQMGIREALNLRYLVSNDKPASATTLTLHQVKMVAANSDWDKLVRALRIIKNRKGPIVIHCKHGADRTGLIVALYRIVFQGWSKENAIDELENGGFNFHTVYANIPSFVRNMDVEALTMAVMEDDIADDNNK